MNLSTSITTLIEQGMNELVLTNVSFFIKVLAIFGVIFLFNIATKTGGSLIYMFIYIIGFFKWGIYKLIGKDDFEELNKKQGEKSK